MKIYKNQTVYDAALERVAFIFDEFESVQVAMSGGKDSIVCMELALIEARKRNRLPLDVYFIDQEFEWQATIDYIQTLTERPEIRLWWVQLPFFIENAASYYNELIEAWGEGQEWIRPKFPGAITENIFGNYRNLKRPADDFYAMHKPVQAHIGGQKKHAVFYGLRADESPSRRLAMTKLGGTYKGHAWTTAGEKKADGWKAGVIWDWTSQDVWAAIANNDWEYNRVYDKMHQIGMPWNRLRVSSLIHGMAAGNHLLNVQEMEPDTYEALVKRLPGISTHSKLGKDIKVKRLPPAYATWNEFHRDLLDKIPNPEIKAQFEKLFDGKMVADLPKDEKLYQVFATAIMNNDYLGVSVQNYRVGYWSRNKFGKGKA